mmetsp:Transcript_15988/g.23962  ORF Transcript_15988/g.23962 Transcript_15988/m.23962 type:complete len:503 (+) Transcript_15988:181-1689(+)
MMPSALLIEHISFSFLLGMASSFVLPNSHQLQNKIPISFSSSSCSSALFVKPLFPEPFAAREDTEPTEPSFSTTSDPIGGKGGGASARAPTRVTLRRYLNNYVKKNPEQESQLRDMESLSLSIQMACKTISNLVNRAGINSLSPPPYAATTTIVDDKEEPDRDPGLIQYDLRMNSMKRLDQLSTTVLRNALRYTGKLQSVKTAKDDEEREEWGIQQGDDGSHQPGILIASALDSKYVAYFDPLDGSGNADAAICTGTVFGIFKTDDDDEKYSDENGDKAANGYLEDAQYEDDGVDNVVLGGGDGNERKAPDTVLSSVLQPGKKLVAAGYCLYSSATILVFTLGEGTHGFTLDPQINEFVLTHPNIKIPPRGNVYSCNEANSEGWSEDVLSYLHALKSGENETEKKYALRYVGSMVGDIHRTLMYGGIFFYPGDSKLYPQGHLQLLYKSAPLSYVIEQAGGSSTNGKISLMDVRPNRVHERSPCFIGSPLDMKEMKTFIQHDE